MSGLKTLVSGGELSRHPEWRVFDCRHDLANPDWGFEAHEKAHIPGARFAHLDRDLSAPRTGNNGRHPLPDPKAFVSWLGNQGLQPSDQVVCYDAGPGTMAARLWWMLRWVRHEAVAVLDGGFAKWMAENRPLSSEVPVFPRTAYEGKSDRTMAVDVAYVERHLKKLTLLDARARALPRRAGTDRPGRGTHSGSAESFQQRQPGRGRHFQARRGTAQGVSGGAR